MSKGYITSGEPKGKGGAPVIPRPYSINDGGVVEFARESRPVQFVAPRPNRLHTFARPARISDR